MVLHVVLLLGRPHVVALHHHELVISEGADPVVVSGLAGVAASMEGREAAARGAWRRASAAARIEPVDAATHGRVGIRVVDHRDFATPRDPRYIVDIERREASVTRVGRPVHRVVDGGVASFRLRKNLAVEVADIRIVEERRVA